jgi:hypothetical protein
MEFDMQSIMDWYEENKEWLLIPAIANIVIVLLGIILIILTGKGAGFLIKILFSFMIIGAPVLGYLLGEYVDPYLAPLFDAAKEQIAKIRNK